MDTLFRLAWWISGGILSAGLILVAGPLIVGVFNARAWAKAYLAYIWPVAITMSLVAIVASPESAVIAGIAVAAVLLWAVKVLAPTLTLHWPTGRINQKAHGAHSIDAPRWPGSNLIRPLRAGETVALYGQVGEFLVIGPNEFIHVGQVDMI